jgi:hypothetical protein
MAKPMLEACTRPRLEATAVLMPRTRPAASTSAPPELPELMAASVWIRCVSVPEVVAPLGSSPGTMPP